MDTLNATVIGAHVTSSLSSYHHHQWNALSSSLMSENDDDTNEVCGAMKIENPFEREDRSYFSNNSSHTATSQQQQRRQQSESPCIVTRTIPLASCATAAASLSSAFNKRLAVSNKNEQPEQQQENEAVMTTDNAQLICKSDSSKQILETLLTNEQHYQHGLTTNSISTTFIKTEQNSQTACYLTTTQPSTASTEEAVVRLREDGTDDEISAAVATSLPNSTTTHTNDIAQMDIYRDLILRHLIQDINATCTKLGLPTDPQAWSAEHSARWMSEMCVQFQLPPPRQLYMNGRTLLSMTQDDFMVRAPEGGDTLHAQLQLWKTAYDSYSQQGDHSSNSNSSHTSSQITQNCNCSPQYWMNPPSLALNAAEQGELLTSAQDYLNNFNPSSTDATANMNCYPNSAYQNISHGRSLVEGTTQQHYYAGAHNVGIGVLPSPSDSEISNDSSINDVNTVDAATVVDVRQTTTSRFARHSGSVHLWHFIRELLDHPKQYSSCVRWVDRQEGTFKIESSHHLARFWGQRKNRTQMNYDKLSRSLRQYYKKGIIQKPEKKQRLVYKFLPPYNL